MFSLIDKSLGKLILYLSKISKTFFVLQPLHMEPKLIHNFHQANHGELTIIIQGPLFNESAKDFLIQTVDFYGKIGIKNFIISLTNYKYYEVIYGLYKQFNNILVIYNDMNSVESGISNINYQKISVLSAIKNVKTKYVLKQRVDQRLVNDNFVSYLFDLIKIFPSKSKQFEDRIICLSSTSLLFVSHHLCDFLQFGRTVDLIEVWNNVEHSDSNRSNNIYIGRTVISNNIKDDNNYYRPEIYLGCAIKKKYDTNINSYNNYIDIIRDVIIIVDQSAVGLIWNKYSSLQVLPYPRVYSEYERISFDIWLRVYSGGTYKIPERVVI